MYANAAQYNKPPTYPVNKVCGGIDGGGFGDDLLGRVFGGLVAYKGNRSCYVNEPTNQSETSVGWRWQVQYIYIITPYILHDSCLDEDGDVVVYNDHGPFLSLYDNCTAD
jgi:hypothetical protein